MKKKILLLVATMALFVCLFAISVSAEAQNYKSYEVVLTDGTRQTVYETYDWDTNEGRVFIRDTMYTEAPVDTEGTYATLDWSTVAELDFTNVWLHEYSSSTGEYTQRAGRQGFHLFSNSFTPANATSLKKVTTGKIVNVRGASLGGLPALEEIVIDNAVTDIQYNAIQNNKVLTTITIKEGTALKTIGQQAFIGCSALESITIPNTVTSMGTNIFESCTSLKNVTWSTGVTKIPDGTFRYCSALKEITIPSGVTSIGENAFCKCTSLESVNIPSGVTSIGKGCFQETAITTVTLPSGLETLGKAAFKDCKSLVTVYGLEDTKVTWMGETFLYCSALTVARMPKGLVTFESSGDGTYKGCTSLTDIGEFPLTLTLIGKQTFDSCSAISGVVDLSKNTLITEIGTNAFARTPMTKFVFPPNVTTLGTHTFSNAANLEELVGLEHLRLAAVPNNLIENCENMKVIKLPINPSDEALEVGAILWDISAHITVYVANDKVAFGSNFYEKSANKVTIVYCGNDYEAFLENNTVIANKVGTNIQSAEVEIDTSKHSFVYGYNVCKAFFDGVHAWSGNATLQTVDYFKDITFADTCGNCELTAVDESKTIGAIFTDLGYAATEEAINGAYAVSQFYEVNKDNLAKYETATGNTVKYGLVASVNAAPSVDASSAGTFVTEQSMLASNYFEIKIVGLTDANCTKALTFCAYVVDNGTVYYLDGGETVTSVTQKSHADVIALLENK